MIKPGDILKNKDLRKIFQCGLQGGMRRSHRTNSLILVSDHTRGIYKDRWEGSILYYTGMGLKGDQSVSISQNKTLAESKNNKVEIYLFEVFNSGEYIYQGRARLDSRPFQEVQLDINKNNRKVWIFPLKLIDRASPAPIPEKDFLNARKVREKNLKKLSEEELRKRIQSGKNKAARRQVISNKYDSNEEIKELAKRKARGKCMLCNNDAPFKDKFGVPFLEGHHIISLADDGPDTEENVVALCPNCHRKMHILGLKSDKELLINLSRG
jgi:5-methylcytosine-specific restriction protein A